MDKHTKHTLPQFILHTKPITDKRAVKHPDIVIIYREFRELPPGGGARHVTSKYPAPRRSN
eukprot:1184915-Prorocentrum_minimum.AAC.6